MVGLMAGMWQFLPARTLQPTDHVLLATGFVIMVLPDPYIPGTHSSALDSLASFTSWGCDVAAEGMPVDVPYGARDLQIVLGQESRLVEHIPGEPDEALLSRLAGMVSPALGQPRLVRLSTRILDPTFDGTPVAEVLYLAPRRLTALDIVIFVDGRRIFQNISALYLTSPRIAHDDLVERPRIMVNVVPGYKLHLEGGVYFQDYLVFRHGEVLTLDLIPDDAGVADPSTPRENGSDASNGSSDDPAIDRGDNDPINANRASRSRSPRRSSDRDADAGQRGESDRGPDAGHGAHPGNVAARWWMHALAIVARLGSWKGHCLQFFLCKL